MRKASAWEDDADEMCSFRGWKVNLSFVPIQIYPLLLDNRVLSFIC